MRRLSSRMTAAATTGPASGPRPASSTPATRPSTSKRNPSCLGGEDFFDGIGGSLCGVAAQLAVQRVESLDQRRAARRLVEPGEGGLGQFGGSGIVLQQLRHGEIPEKN